MHTPRPLVVLCLVLGCSSNSIDGPVAQVGPWDVSLEVEVDASIGTVVHVHWESGQLSSGYVRATSLEGQEHSSQTDPEPSQVHDSDLIGLKADTTYLIEVVADSDGGELLSEVVEVHTPSLDASLPVLDVEIRGNGPESGFIALALMTDEAAAGSSGSALVLDDEGDIVWSRELGEGLVTSVELSLDGTALLAQDEMGILEIPLDGSEALRHDVEFAHHDFAQLPDGTLAFIQSDDREFEEGVLLGDAIVELGADGELREVWSFWSDVEAFGVDVESVLDGGMMGDLTHANSLAYAEEEDAYYLSMAVIPALAKIDRSTGELLWSLTPSQEGTLRLVAEGDDPWSVLHTVEPLGPDHVLWFLNTSRDDVCARVVELERDEEVMVQVDTLHPGDGECLTVFGLGDVQRLSGGSTLVTWSTAGVLEELDLSGEPTLRLSTPFGFALSYGEKVAELGVAR